MDAKRALTNGVFCPMPWTGLMYNFDGSVKNCIRSAGYIGDLKTQTIGEILSGDINTRTQKEMLEDRPGPDCHTCYDLENGKKRLDIISDRIFYIRELKSVPFETYRTGNHELRTMDVRWTNLCNFACVYCGPQFSSRWSQELQQFATTPGEQRLEEFKSYIFDRAADLDHVYLAGGEPLLMKQNQELLERLMAVNPKVQIRINTNLSKVDTRVFEMICGFENVHWTVSVETQGSEFEYIRYGGSWQDFQVNLAEIRQKSHRISFNMLWFLLNYRSLFDTVDWLREQGYHPNSFIIGALLEPLYLNIRHLPDAVLQSLRVELRSRIDQNPGYLLEDSYRNLLHYIGQPMQKNLVDSMHRLRQMDQRRNIDSRETFPDLYSIIEEHHGQTF